MNKKNIFKNVDNKVKDNNENQSENEILTNNNETYITCSLDKRIFINLDPKNKSNNLECNLSSINLSKAQELKRLKEILLNQSEETTVVINNEDESQNANICDFEDKNYNVLEPIIKNFSEKRKLEEQNSLFLTAVSKKLERPINNKNVSKLDGLSNLKISDTAQIKKSLSFKLRKLFIENKNNSKPVIIKPYRNYFLLKCALFLLVVVSSFLIYCLWDLPDYKILSSYNPPLVTRVFSSDGYILSEYAVEKRSYVFINDIPKVVKEAFISAEDKNFYSNYGFDFAGLLRSLWNDLLYILGQSKNITGASTITQQVVKNLLLTKERTIQRKIREAVLTFQLERSFTKDHILELYLNAMYLGNGSYGIAVASLNYFAKPVSELTLAEAAYLASIPKAPSRYNPVTRNKLAVTRRNWVINRMLFDGKITQSEASQAQREPLIVKERKNLDTGINSYAAEESRKNLLDQFGYDVLYHEGLTVQTSIDNKYQKYAYDSLRWGINRYEMKKGYTGPAFSVLSDKMTAKQLLQDTEGLPNWYILLHEEKRVVNYNKIVAPWETAIVLDVKKDEIKVGLSDNTMAILYIQDNLWAAPYDINNIDVKLDDFNTILKVGDVIFIEQQNDKPWSLRQIPKVNGAIVVMNPQNGQILAMQGGYSYLLSQFNRVTQAKRQLGSAFKPIIYLSAIEKGIKTSDLFLDAPFVYRNDKLDWKPQNNSNVYSGLITMRRSLEFSRNLATIRIGNLVGLDAISQLSKKLGIYDTSLDNLSNLLGSKETTLMNVVKAFSVLANGGKDVTPHIIEMIQDNEGKAIYKNDKRECIECNNVAWENQSPPMLEENRKLLVNPKDAYLIVNLMQGVVQRGSGRYAYVEGYNIAGKTGTSNDDKDTWFIGFTPDLIVGIYVGADVPVSLGKDLESSRITVPIFYNFMLKALKDREKLPFRVPEGINMYWVNYLTGKLSSPSQRDAILEVFKDNQKPDKEEDVIKQGVFYRDGASDSAGSSQMDNGIW